MVFCCRFESQLMSKRLKMTKGQLLLSLSSTRAHWKEDKPQFKTNKPSKERPHKRLEITNTMWAEMRKTSWRRICRTTAQWKWIWSAAITISKMVSTPTHRAKSFCQKAISAKSIKRLSSKESFTEGQSRFLKTLALRPQEEMAKQVDPGWPWLNSTASWLLMPRNRSLKTADLTTRECKVPPTTVECETKAFAWQPQMEANPTILQES